MSDVRN